MYWDDGLYTLGDYGDTKWRSNLSYNQTCILETHLGGSGEEYLEGISLQVE